MPSSPESCTDSPLSSCRPCIFVQPGQQTDRRQLGGHAAAGRDARGCPTSAALHGLGCRASCGEPTCGRGAHSSRAPGTHAAPLPGFCSRGCRVRSAPWGRAGAAREDGPGGPQGSGRLCRPQQGAGARARPGRKGAQPGRRARGQRPPGAPPDTGSRPYSGPHLPSLRFAREDSTANDLRPAVPQARAARCPATA